MRWLRSHWTQLAFLALVLVLIRLLPADATISAQGQARVIDGDSLVVNGVEIRLRDVDAPEGRQICQRGGQVWACGQEATKKLAARIGGRTVQCSGTEYDQHDRLLGVCHIGEDELNEWLVAEGWAVALGSHKAAEARARSEGRGIWQGSFMRPSAWRKANGN